MRLYTKFLGGLAPSLAKHVGLGKAFKKAGRLGLAKRVDYVCSGKYNFATRE